LSWGFEESQEKFFTYFLLIVAFNAFYSALNPLSHFLFGTYEDKTKAAHPRTNSSQVE